MFSLLYRTSHQVQSSLFNPIARAIAITGRAHATSTTGPEWTPTHQYASKSSENRARRRATDPEYREKLSAKNKEWYKKTKASRYVYHRAWHEENKDRVRARLLKHKLSHDYEKLYHAPKRARWASDDHYKQRELLRDWVSVNPWVRDLTWQTHKPNITGKVVHYCGGCKTNKSLKLWWQDNKNR